MAKRFKTLLRYGSLNLKNIYKYIQLIIAFCSITFATEIEYRFNLIIEIISVIGNLLGSILILSLFYQDNNTHNYSCINKGNEYFVSHYLFEKTNS